jgi:DNA polymerase III epsilon subunit-like protein
MGTSIRSQLFRVFDTETTGLDPRTDAVVELAWAIMRGDGTILSSNTTLINPGRHIPADASRVHGLFDRDVAQAPTFGQAVEKYTDLYVPTLPAVCHNASFDSVLLRRSPRLADGNPRFLCTLRLTQNLVPGCRSYRLDSLRSSLGLGAHVEGPVAHRAANDVATASLLLKHLIDRYLGAGYADEIDGLFEVATIQRMPFGKHEGKLLTDVPPDYIDWLLSRDIDDDLRSALSAARSSTLKPAIRAPSRGHWWWPF